MKASKQIWSLSIETMFFDKCDSLNWRKTYEAHISNIPLNS